MSDTPSLRGAPLPIIAQEAPRRERAEPNPEIRRVAEEFEAVFLTEMLAPMFESLDTDGLGGGGEGERMFRPMLVERYAEAISRAGGVGIAENIIAELTRMHVSAQREPPNGADR